MANSKNLKPFKKGDSRINRGGRPKTKFISDWLTHPDREKDMVKMLKKTMKLAISGNMSAVNFIAYRTEGKAISYLDMEIQKNPDKDKPISVFEFVDMTDAVKVLNSEESPKEDSQPKVKQDSKVSTR